MPLLFISFIAGVLSVLAPCIVGVLPLLITRGIDEKSDSNRTQYAKLLRVVVGLSLSIFIFSLLLKSTTLLISVPQSTWRIISGVIIVLFGVSALFPNLWEKIATRLQLQNIASRGQIRASQTTGTWGDYLLGASFGPIFSACSPTYLLILAVLIPSSFLSGVGYLVAFIAGLSLAIITIAIISRKLIAHIGWAINPHGNFKKIIGILFICIGILIATGSDKQIQAYFVEKGYFDWQIKLESNFTQ